MNLQRSCTGLRWLHVLLVLFSLNCLAWGQTENALKEGDATPNFSISTDGGKRITPINFGGRLLVLNFWETACVPCVKELPSLTAFARRFRQDGVVVVAVSGDESAEKYRRFLSDHHVVLETHRDPSRKIGKSFGTYLYPETYIIQDGRIARKVVGAIDWTSDDTASFVRARLAAVEPQPSPDLPQ